MSKRGTRGGAGGGGVSADVLPESEIEVITCPIGADLDPSVTAVTRTTTKIPLVGTLIKLVLKLSGTITIAAGGGNASTLAEDGILRWLQDIRLWWGGRPVKKYCGRVVYHALNTYDNGVAGVLTQPGVTVAAHAFEAVAEMWIIPRRAGGAGYMRGAGGFGLPLRRSGAPQVRLEIDYCALQAAAGENCVFLAGDRTYALSALVTTLQAWYDKRVLPQEYSFCRELEVPHIPTAAASNALGEQIPLEHSADRLRRIVGLAIDTDARSNAIGTFLGLELEANVLKAQGSFADWQRETRSAQGLAVTAGQFALDFDREGSGRGLPPIGRYGNPNLRYVHGAQTAPAYLRYVAQELVIAGEGK